LPRALGFDMSEIIGKPASPTIFQLLSEAKRKIGAVGKNDLNQVQKFKFRGIDAVVNAIAPAFNELGIIVVPEVREHEYDTVTTAGGKPMGHVVVVVKYAFHGPAGDSVSAVVLGEAFDSGDKAVPKAMSVAFRIALLQTLNLPTDEPDPDSESYERVSASAKATRVATGVSNPRVDWGQAIAGAATTGKLNEIWKQAGAIGALGDKSPNGDGEMMTVKDLLYARKDELDLKSGV
jgi:hypothetical protein